MKSKLKIQVVGFYFAHTVDSMGLIIYNQERRTPAYDAVGANYQVILGTEQICW